jgi:BASS family bile acid:Na+ symporter
MTLQHGIMLGLQASIFLTVFGFGLQATTGDVLYLVRRPAALWRSLLAMFVIMPIVAVVATAVLNLHAAVEIAIVALALSPVPPLLPKRQVEAGGRASYALGLMVLAALISVAIIPPALYLLGLYFAESFTTNPQAVARVALLTVLVPLASGMVVRRVAAGVAARIQKPVALLAAVLLAIGVLAILVAAAPASWALVGNGTILALAAWVIVGLAVGHVLGGPNPDERIVLALSTACRHPAIALTVAMTAFPQERLLIGAILLYLVLGLLVSLPYVKRQRLPPSVEA